MGDMPWTSVQEEVIQPDEKTSTGAPATAGVVHPADETAMSIADLERMQAMQRRAIINRLKRANGQLQGVIKMLEDDRECHDVITQLAAVSKAIDRAGFKIISSAMRGCIYGSGPAMSTEDIENLFLRLS